MKKLNVEGWRIVKFLLMTLAVHIPLSLLYGKLTPVILATLHTGMWLSLMSYAYNLLSAAIAALVNRYFTFRATKEWYIAVPLVMLAAILFKLLSGYVIILLVHFSDTAEAMLTASSVCSLLWFVLSYLLQRCVIYRRTLDTNAWYHRFHPAYEASDKGGTPDEEA